MLNRFFVLFLGLLAAGCAARTPMVGIDESFRQARESADPEKVDRFLSSTVFRWECGCSDLKIDECQLFPVYPGGKPHPSSPSFRLRQISFGHRGLLAKSPEERASLSQGDHFVPEFSRRYERKIRRVTRRFNNQLERFGLADPEQGKMPSLREAWPFLIRELERKPWFARRSAADYLMAAVEPGVVSLAELAPPTKERIAFQIRDRDIEIFGSQNLPYEVCNSQVKLRGTAAGIAAHEALISADPDFRKLFNDLVFRFERTVGPRGSSGRCVDTYLTNRFHEMVREAGIDERLLTTAAVAVSQKEGS